MSDDQRVCAGSDHRDAVDDVAVEFDASLASLLRRTDASGGVVDGPLPVRLREARAGVAAAVGFALPPVHLRAVADLPEHTYRVLVRGAEVARGFVVADRAMAIDPHGTSTGSPGIAARDPSFGMPARWVERDDAKAARAAGLTVVDACTVVVTHVGELLRRHAVSLFGREEALARLDVARAVSPRPPRVCPSWCSRIRSCAASSSSSSIASSVTCMSLRRRRSLRA